MDRIWMDLYNAAKAVQNPRELSERVYAGGVAAAIESTSGNIYTGVCVDTSCTLGICAERNALFNMITNGENKVRRILAIMPDGTTGAPCGACRELLKQLMFESSQKVEIMLDYKQEKIVTLSELTPEWWL
ncbi:MAG: cytidine deaminase [Clostridia bacterium]|nr:cytidine deaminase [Clostridia bacterium]